MKPFLCLILATTLLSGCASKKLSERQQYEKATNSFTYKTYRSVSKSSVDASLALYKKAKNTDDVTSAELVHAMAGLSLALGQKPVLALAEGELAQKAAPKGKDAYIGLSVLSLAMYQNNWPGLGREYAARARLQADGELQGERYQDRRLIAQSILGALAIKEGRGDVAEDMFAELGNKSGYTWLPVAAHALAIMTEGPLSAPGKLTELLNRPALSLEQRQKLEELKVLAKKNQSKPKKAQETNFDLLSEWTTNALLETGEEVLKQTLEAVIRAVGKAP